METVDRVRNGGTRVKGFLFVSVLAAVLFAIQWVYARMAAWTGPVDTGVR